MQNKKTVLVLSCLLVIIVGALTVFLIINTSSDDSKKEKYNKKLSLAGKYVQEERWDDAIVAYLEVIEYNDEDEEAYYTLAQIYLYKSMMEEAKLTLEKGIEKTGSQRLQELYSRYFLVTTASNVGTEKESGHELTINSALLKQISTYTLNDYTSKYGSPTYDVTGDSCAVTHKNLQGVSFVYYNTQDNQSIIDSSTGRPKEDKMPGEALFDNLSILFTGMGEKIEYSKLEGLKLTGLRKTKDNTRGFYIVQFENSNCTVLLACDDDGNVELDAWNQIIPKNSNGSEDNGEKKEVHGTVVSATTGKGISDVLINIRERGVTQGDTLATIDTGRNGEYGVNLEPGEYTAEIEADGYIAEDIDFEVDKWGELDIAQFVISEKLEEGQIRIVLEWGEYPSDLDSHLEGTTGDGRSIHIYFSHRYEEEANLDVDDTDSYGPETTTVLDITGNYKFYVHDFTMSGNIGSSSATVKVYMPGERTPRVYEVPPITGNIWDVFRIENGQIIDY